MFVVIGKDWNDGGERRAHSRAAHLRFVVDRQNDIAYAGPLIENGRMIGSIFIFKFSDRSELDAYLAADPYFTDGVFETLEIYESRWMVPEREPGFLEAEARRAEDTRKSALQSA